MKTIIVLFNLKPGVEKSVYERWAMENDLPVVRSLPSVDAFHVLRADGLLGSDKPAPFEYIEIIHVNDMKSFGEDTGTVTMAAIAEAFQAYADNPTFILTEAVE